MTKEKLVLMLEQVHFLERRPQLRGCYNRLYYCRDKSGSINRSRSRGRPKFESGNGHVNADLDLGLTVLVGVNVNVSLDIDYGQAEKDLGNFISFINPFD
ncbi:hypothetical protein [Lactococcus protaetiae]|uniref:Uncharacterized protein n=1 Tax=Lactococcus protaetiae TaxID=2592653 RepID=A0A514Z9Z8_9LACT|nr:hypothetical protein [Lactococcus protaetiae]QDK71377.1 hypothetical protein FLP15_09690 [Lactococcus protaetiae]